MSVVIIQREKESFLRTCRQYLTCINNTGVLANIKNSMHFISPSKKKKMKKIEAFRKVCSLKRNRSRNQFSSQSKRNYKSPRKF